MVRAAATLHCTVITPDAMVVDASAAQVVLPAHDGLMGVLPGHAPMVCRMGAGLLRYHDADNTEHMLFVEDGFTHICADEVTILTTQAVKSDQIGRAEADEQLRHAQALPTNTLEEVQTRSAAIERAKYLIQIAELPR